MKKGIYTIYLVTLPLAAYFTIFLGLAGAHDLWLNVDKHYPHAGEKINAKIAYGHKFPYSDILVSRDTLTDFSYLAPDGEKMKITKTWEEKQGERSGVLVGEITVNREGTYIITSCNKRQGDKEHVPSEKYAKSIVIVGKGTENISHYFGHRIEIVPLKNPSEVKPGAFLPVKILYEGKPLSTYVYATYEGYSSKDEPFPFFTRSDENGVANIKISQAGIWMVVCNHKVNLSASLTFEIK